MSLVVGDIYRVTWFQRLLGQNVLNVQFYEMSEAEVDATEVTMAEAAFGKWQTNILPLQSLQLTLNQVKVENVSDGLGIGFWTPSPVLGTISGDVMPPFVTWSFQQTRGSRVTRHGHKYVGGIPEASVINGSTTLSPAQLAFFENVFVDPLEVDDSVVPLIAFSAIPRIVGRKESLTTPGSYELDLTKINPITGLVFRGVSTENLRKLGRGF